MPKPSNGVLGKMALILAGPLKMCFFPSRWCAMTLGLCAFGEDQV